jgi:hypothetical protein
MKVIPCQDYLMLINPLDLGFSILSPYFSHSTYAYAPIYVYMYDMYVYVWHVCICMTCMYMYDICIYILYIYIHMYMYIIYIYILYLFNAVHKYVYIHIMLCMCMYYIYIHLCMLYVYIVHIYIMFDIYGIVPKTITPLHLTALRHQGLPPSLRWGGHLPFAVAVHVLLQCCASRFEGVQQFFTMGIESMGSTIGICHQWDILWDFMGYNRELF